MQRQIAQESSTTEYRAAVYEMLGENCMTTAQGRELYSVIYPKLSVGNSVTLDFARVRIFSSTFFSYAIAQLLRDLNPEFLNEKLKIEHLNPVGEEMLEAAIDGASRFYFKN